MRKSHLDEGNRWLNQAKADLKWAKHLAREGGWHIACFLAQQVTEKALKAYLYANGREVVIGHSVARLCQAASEYDLRFSDFSKRWSILDGYYIPTRYPNGLPDGIPAEVYTQEAAKSAVGMADEAVQFISTLLEIN